MTAIVFKDPQPISHPRSVKYRIHIEELYRQGTPPYRDSTSQMLRLGTNRCDCPDIHEGRYLITGHVSKYLRLTVDTDSYVREYPRLPNATQLLQDDCSFLLP